MEVGQGFSVLTCRRDLVLGGDKTCGITQLKIVVNNIHSRLGVNFLVHLQSFARKIFFL